jgi:hypothetical protein
MGIPGVSTRTASNAQSASVAGFQCHVQYVEAFAQSAQSFP